MPKLGTKFVTLVKPCSILTIALSLPVAINAAPAHAQGLFGFLKLFAPPAPAPTYQPFEPGSDLTSERPRYKAHTRPKPASADEIAVKKPVKPRAPGEMENPFPALLADGTLQPGDMVMFPDGLRVFTGQPGSQHRMADFKPLSQAGKALSRETRKLVAHLLPSENPAWSTAGLRHGSKLAANTRDVETTGSIKPAGSRENSRSRR